MLILTLGGGLGNQMFQYGYARHIQQLTGESTIYINDSEVIKEADRFYSLGTLNVKDIRILPRFISKPVNECERFIRKLLVKVLKVLGNDEEKIFQTLNILGIYYHPSVYKFYDSKSSVLPVKIIEGGFQSWKYLANNKDLKNELRVSNAPSMINQEILTQILNSESVCVHVRRGDYLLAKYKNLNVCNYQYYLNSMKYILDNVENPTFFVFSNSAEDLDWIKVNYKLPGNIIYVKNDNPDYEELRLMYSCKHFIISNSTFSWWGQYLSERNGIVVAPKVWNRMSRDGIEDLYMPNWITMEVEFE